MPSRTNPETNEVPPNVDLRNAKMSALSGFFGSTIEYFDFVAFAAASALVFNKVFFASMGPTGATIASFATFGVAYVARPLGAVIFGQLGDRVGRTKTLIYTLLLMGLATFLIGLLPTPATIGVWAPVLLVVLRLAQGLSAGGEQAGSNSLSSENAPADKRGLYTGWTMIGVAFGSVLGSAAFIPITALGTDFLLSWGWRVPFLLAGPLMLFTMWIRSQVKEPEVFREVVAAEGAAPETAEKVALLEVVRNHWKNLLRVIFCSLFALAGTMGNVFAVTYATQYAGLSATVFLSVSSLVGLLLLVVSPMWAIASDKVGRKPVFIFSVLGMTVVFPLLFASMQSKNWALIVAAFIALQIVAAAGNIVQAPFYTEMFPTKVRYTGYAIGTQVGLVVVGFSPAIAASIVKEGTFGWWPVAVMIAVALMVAAVSAATAKETRGLEIHRIDALVTR